MSSASVTGVSALLDKAVGAFRARIERRARHSEDFATLLKRKARSDQRARALGGFDDDDPKRQPRDQSIAARKIPRARFPAERHFSKRRPRGQDIVEQIDMFGRIDAVLAAGKNRHRAGCDAGAVRGGIDAAR